MGFGFAVFSQMSSTLLIGKVGQTFLRRPHNCNVIIFTSFVIKIVFKDKHLQVCGYSCEDKCNQLLVFLVCLLTFWLGRVLKALYHCSIVWERKAKIAGEGVKSIVPLRAGRRRLLKEQTASRNLTSKWALAGQKLLSMQKLEWTRRWRWRRTRSRTSRWR